MVVEASSGAAVGPREPSERLAGKNLPSVVMERYLASTRLRPRCRVSETQPLDRPGYVQRLRDSPLVRQGADKRVLISMPIMPRCVKHIRAYIIEAVSRPMSKPRVVEDLLVGESEAAKARIVSRGESLHNGISQDSLSGGSRVEAARCIKTRYGHTTEVERARRQLAKAGQVNDRNSVAGGVDSRSPHWRPQWPRRFPEPEANRWESHSGKRE